MKAIAKQIGNSQKEQIIFDGRVFLKSVEIGKWNYLVKFEREEDGAAELIKCKSLATAEKATSFYAGSPEYVVSINGRRDDDRELNMTEAEFRVANPSCREARVKKYGMTVVKLIGEPHKIRKTVIKIERS